MATINMNLSAQMSLLKSDKLQVVSDRRFSNFNEVFFNGGSNLYTNNNVKIRARKSGKRCVLKDVFIVRSVKVTEPSHSLDSPNGSFSPGPFELQSSDYLVNRSKFAVNAWRKTKIVSTIGPSTSTRKMIWKLAEEGMNVARLNMSHGDHASHQKTIDLVREYNAQFDDKIISIMLDTKGPEVRSGDVPRPILLKEGQEFNFTIQRGVSTQDTVSVNYDDFVNDVEVGDMLLVDDFIFVWK